MSDTYIKISPIFKKVQFGDLWFEFVHQSQ